MLNLTVYFGEFINSCWVSEVSEVKKDIKSIWKSGKNRGSRTGVGHLGQMIKKRHAFLLSLTIIEEGLTFLELL